MKTSEMIALLEKNPKLKFTSSLNGLTFTAFVNEREEIEFAKMAGAISLNRDWQLVREPVPWQEALQAWIEGKTVKCVMDLDSYFTLKPKEDTPIFNMHWLKKGVWYIEDPADE